MLNSTSAKNFCVEGLAHLQFALAIFCCPNLQVQPMLTLGLWKKHFCRSQLLKKELSLAAVCILVAAILKTMRRCRLLFTAHCRWFWWKRGFFYHELFPLSKANPKLCFSGLIKVSFHSWQSFFKTVQKVLFKLPSENYPLSDVTDPNNNPDSYSLSLLQAVVFIGSVSFSISNHKQKNLFHERYK